MQARRHWAIGLVLVAAAVLVFTGLGRDYLWADEGDTAVLARSILQFAVPTAWDGLTFTDSDFGARLNDQFVMVSHPWLQYYVTAASFAIFDESAWAARLPFALFGLATIGLVYVLVLQATRNRWTAVSASILLTLSVQFLLYSRQSRHYTLNAALTCLLVWQFGRLNSRANSALFAVIAILLFHSLPIAVAPLLALGLLARFHPAFQDRWRWYRPAALAVAAGTLPWLLVARTGYAETMTLAQDVGPFLGRLAQFAVECASVTPVVGVMALAIWVAMKHPLRDRREAAQIAEQRHLIIVLVSIVGAYALMMAATQPRDTIFTAGLRYTPAVIPFMAMIAAMLIGRVSGARRVTWLALLLVFGLTKAARITPWTYWAEPAVVRDRTSAVTFHNPERPIDRIARTGQIGFVRSLFEPNEGTVARIVEYLRSHARSTDIVITNYEWEPLYFHTGLRQGMTVLKSYPVYEAVRAQSLPEYVYSAKGARWIVWRRAWGPYRGQRLDTVLASLKAEGTPVTLVAQFPETMWENREGVHFRRFPGNRYVYPWYENVPDTLIYRIDGVTSGN